MGLVVPGSKVGEANLDIFLLSNEFVVFAELLPAIWSIIALGRPKRQVRSAFHHLAGRRVDRGNG
jgi:hypothetical protein